MQSTGRLTQRSSKQPGRFPRWIMLPAMAGLVAALGAAAPSMAAEPRTEDDEPVSTPGEPVLGDPVEIDAGAPENPILSRARVLRREPVVGDQVRVVYGDGRIIEGALVRQLEGLLTMRIAGAEVQVEITPADRVEVLESIEDRYRTVRASIPDADSERILALAVWLQRQRLYEFALVETEHVLEREPTNAEALRLKRTLLPQIELQQRQRESARDAAPKAPRDAARPLKPDEFPMLTPDQINLIRVYELDLKDPPRLVIPRETIGKLLERYAGHPLIPTTKQGRDAFYRREPVEVLDVMFRVQARELYPEVQVMTNPRSMDVFRDRIHATWLVNSAATTQCHGGSKAGRFVLLNRRPTSPAAVYTNFLIIDRYKMADGTPLIDWAEPENSPLLHLGLTPSESLFPHPKVEGWQPVFTSRDSRRFKQAVEWIRMMYRPRPEYPIEYDPPSFADPTSPSAPPATKAPDQADPTPVQR